MASAKCGHSSSVVGLPAAFSLMITGQRSASENPGFISNECPVCRMLVMATTTPHFTHLVSIDVLVIGFVLSFPLTVHSIASRHRHVGFVGPNVRSQRIVVLRSPALRLWGPDRVCGFPRAFCSPGPIAGTSEQRYPSAPFHACAWEDSPLFDAAGHNPRHPAPQECGAARHIAFKQRCRWRPAIEWTLWRAHCQMHRSDLRYCELALKALVHSRTADNQMP